MSRTDSAPESSGFGRRRVMTLVATGTGLFMIFLDATIVNVALPDIQRDFGAGEQGLQWVVAAYSLTMGMFIMSAATLADARGRRRVFVAGTALFAVASAVCGAAPDLAVLNVARGLQGVGAALVNVASLSLVSAAFPERGAKARAIGIWTAIASVGLAVGPTLGGVLTESLGWRSVFYVNVAIAAVGIVLVMIFVDESRDPVARGVDPLGQVLFLVGVGALTYALIEGPHSGWDSPLILGLFSVAAVVAVVFVWVEARRENPMMDVRVFGDRVYTVALCTLFVVLFSIYGMFLVVTQYLQNVRGFGPEQAGLTMLANTVPTIVCAPLAGYLAARLGARRPVLSGLTAMVVGLAVLAVGVGGSDLVLLVGLALVGVAIGLTATPATGIAMSSVPPDRSGMASGMMSAQRALGSTAGFAVMGSVLAAVVAANLPARFEAVLPAAEARVASEQVVRDANPRAVAALVGPGRPLPDAVGRSDELVAAAERSFVEGVRVALAVGALLSLAALVAGALVFPRRDADTNTPEGSDALTSEDRARRPGGPGAVR